MLVTTTTQPHFAVDKDGLAKLLERRGKHFAVYELIQNAWDEDSKNVSVDLFPTDKAGVHRLMVIDDNPDGFKDLTHAYTLFAESEKKDNPEKRGRFNLGEKLVLAICEEARIVTTKGTIKFDADGRTEWTHPDFRSDHGTEFCADIRMTRQEAGQVEKLLTTLIPPIACRTTFNGRLLQDRIPARTFKARLQTEIADEDGRLLRRTRETDVSVYKLMAGEKAHLYELGIPVQRIDTPWHVDIRQKVPLTLDREAVSASFARAVKAEVLNHTADLVPEEDAGDKWISEALEDKRITAEAANTALTKRFGEKRVVFDPSDLEANKVAVSKGYTVIPGRALSAKAHDTVKRFELAQPAGQVTPSHASIELRAGESDKYIKPPYSPGMARISSIVGNLGPRLIGRSVRVHFLNDATVGAAAFYGNGELTFNVGRLGYAWFDQDPGSEHVVALVLHELAHERVSDHLSHAFHDECCHLGARLANLIAEDDVVRGWFMPESRVVSS